MEKTALGLNIQLHTDFQSAEERVTAALKSQGFGVLTEIDVKSTLKKKLDVDFRPYKILGACNPPLAHQALNSAPEIGLLLPCNVTLSETAPGVVDVSMVNPLVMMGILDDPALEPVAHEAYDRLLAVIDSLEE